MPAQKPCKTCGQAIVLVHAPAGGVIPLEPFPIEPGHQSAQAVPVGVDRAGGGRVAWQVIARADAGPATKWYERHKCVTARNAVPPPHKRTEQLGLEIDVRPANPGRW